MQYRLTPLAAALALAFVVPMGIASLAQAQTTSNTGTAASSTDSSVKSDKDLPSITVNASADASADGLPEEYAGGQVARGGRVGFLGNQDILDTPFSTTSYTQEYIKDQQAQGIGDILQSDPTVRVTRGYGNFQEMFVIRGMPTNSDDLSYNGLYGILPRQYVAAELFERVEVLRGASAFLNGMAPGSGSSSSSAIGGTINLLPKRATNDPLTEVTFGWETGGQGYYAVDMGRRLGDENRLGIRINAVRRGEGGTATSRENNELSMGSVGLDYRGNDFRLSADFGLQEQRLTNINPSVSLATGVAVPSAPSNSTNFSQPWSYSNERDEFGTLRGEWDLNASTTAWAAYGYRHGIERNSLSGVQVTASGGAAATYRFDNSRDDVVNTGEVGIRNKFDTGPVKHEVSTTASVYQINERAAYGYSDYYALATNIYTPTNYASPALTTTGGDLANPLTIDRKQLGSVAIADTLSILDKRLEISLGIRKQYLKDTGYDYNTGIQSSYYDTTATTPLATINYKLLNNLSVYANYVEGLQAGTTVTSATAVNYGQVLAPYKSKQKEVGLKYDAGKVGLTAALFTTSVPNVYEDSTTHIVSANGNQRNRGAEFTAFGLPMRGVRLLAGLTILDAKQQSTSGGTYNGKQAVGVSKTQANASVDWDVPGVQGLSANVRAIYTGPEYLDAANTQELSPWVRYDAGMRYVTSIGGKVVTFRGSIENLTNKNYWASAGGAYGTGYMVLGEGRTVVLSAAVDF